MDIGLLIAQWSGQLPPGFLLPGVRPEARPECSHKRCHRPVAVKRNGGFAKACQPCLDRRAQSCRRPRALFCRPGRLPALRVPEAGRGRFPLSAVSRGPRRRARAEALGRHRRGGGRRVRGEASDRAPDEQSGLRSVAVEREAEAGCVRRLLVAPSRSGAQGRAGVALVAVQRPPAPPVLIRPPRSRRGGSGRRAVARAPRVGRLPPLPLVAERNPFPRGSAAPRSGLRVAATTTGKRVQVPPLLPDEGGVRRSASAIPHRSSSRCMASASTVHRQPSRRAAR